MNILNNQERTIYYVYGQCEIIAPKYTPPAEPPAGFQELTEEEEEYMQSVECLRSPTWQSMRQPTKMTPLLVERFYRAFLDGASNVELQSMFNLKKHNVWDLLHGKTWKNYESTAKKKALDKVDQDSREKKRRLASNSRYIHKHFAI